MRLPLHSFLFPVAIFLLLQSSALGQNSANGTVFDPNGAAVAGCILRLESSAGAVLQQTLTDERGHYRLPIGAEGDYVLIASPARGFAEASVPVHFGGGSVAAIDIHLSIEQVVQKLEVVSDSPSVAADAAAN